MSEQETTGEAGQAAIHERCLCREMVDQVREHFNNSRIEFLKGIRAIIDHRIEQLSKTPQHGTKIAVE